MTIDTATLRALLAAKVRAQADLDSMPLPSSPYGYQTDEWRRWHALVDASAEADDLADRAAVDHLPALLDALDAAESRACAPAERAVIEAASRWWHERADDNASQNALAARVADLEAERMRGGR